MAPAQDMGAWQTVFLFVLCAFVCFFLWLYVEPRMIHEGTRPEWLDKDGKTAVGGE